MQNNSLLFGIIGFILGGLLVSIAATTFEKPNSKLNGSHGSVVSMDSMVHGLKSKTGSDFDKAFLADMIIHHQSAVDMAELAKTRAHDARVKNLSKEIIAAQQSEISLMRQWQTDIDSKSSHNQNEKTDAPHP